MKHELIVSYTGIGGIMDTLYHNEMMEISNWLMSEYPGIYHTLHLETVYKILEFHRGEVWKVKADLEHMFG